jgi:hypothetical protein
MARGYGRILDFSRRCRTHSCDYQPSMSFVCADCPPILIGFVSSSNRQGLAKSLHGFHKRLASVTQQTGSIIDSVGCISLSHSFVLSSFLLSAEFNFYFRLICCLVGGCNHDSIFNVPVAQSSDSMRVHNTDTYNKTCLIFYIAISSIHFTASGNIVCIHCTLTMDRRKTPNRSRSLSKALPMVFITHKMTSLYNLSHRNTHSYL